MGIDEDTITAEHVAFAKRLRCCLLKMFAQRGKDLARGMIPGFWQNVRWIVRPVRAAEIVAFGKVFSSARAERGPAELIFRRVLRHLDWLIEQVLALIHEVEEELIHEVADCHTEVFPACSKVLVGGGQS